MIRAGDTSRPARSIAVARVVAGLVTCLISGGVCTPAQSPAEDALHGRIVAQLRDIAAAARGVGSPEVRLERQLEAARLLWPHAPEVARDTWSSAFAFLLPGSNSSTAELVGRVPLLAALLGEVASLDPELAQRFLDRLEADVPVAGAQRLHGVTATSLLDVDVERALGVARTTPGAPVTEEYVRFLIVLRGIDATRADSLYGEALSAFAAIAAPSPLDIQVMASYLTSAGDSAGFDLADEQARPLLDAVLRQVLEAPIDSREGVTAYYVGQRLLPLFRVHCRDSVAALETRLAVLAQATHFTASPPRPHSRDDSAVSRTMAALDRDDLKAVHAELASVGDPSVRAGIEDEVVRRLLGSGRLDDAESTIARFGDPLRRSVRLADLGRAAWARHDRGRALEALDNALVEAARGGFGSRRSYATLRIANELVAIDPMRAFEAIQAAVAAMNTASRVGERRAEASVAGEVVDGAVVEALLGETLGELSRSDLDRALLLAASLDDLGVRLGALLAVCSHGLEDVRTGLP